MYGGLVALRVVARKYEFKADVSAVGQKFCRSTWRLVGMCTLVWVQGFWRHSSLEAQQEQQHIVHRTAQRCTGHAVLVCWDTCLLLCLLFRSRW
jgi:hypothetical protein